MPSASRPDPSMGVFETMLILDGAPIELDAHLERLTASLELLFGLAPPRSIATTVRDRAKEIGLGRLRVALAPTAGDGAEIAISTAEIETAAVFPLRDRIVALQSLVVPGGLGAHKWTDRSLLERAEAEAATVPLLLDRDGTVLEAAKGNLFAVRDGRLRTPPADGRILPGVTRRRALELARQAEIEVSEEEMRLGDLVSADEVFLTGSIGGVEPVRFLDGMDLAGSGEISGRIAADLRSLWLAESGPAAAAVLATAPPPGLPVR